MRQDSVPILFRTHQAGAPAEKENGICTVSNRLRCPKGQLSWARCAAHRLPTGDSRLLLHNPKGSLLHRTDHIELCRHVGRNGQIKALTEMPAGVLIVRGEVQLFSEVIIVYFFRKAHHVMGDKFIRRGFSQYLCLHLMKIAHQIGAKALPVQQLRWILSRSRLFGRMDL